MARSGTTLGLVDLSSDVTHPLVVASSGQVQYSLARNYGYKFDVFSLDVQPLNR